MFLNYVQLAYNTISPPPYFRKSLSALFLWIGLSGSIYIRCYATIVTSYGSVAHCYSVVVLAGMNCDTDATAQYDQKQPMHCPDCAVTTIQLAHVDAPSI